MRQFAVAALTLFVWAIQPLQASERQDRPTAASAETTGARAVGQLHAGLLDIMQRAEDLSFSGRTEVMSPIVETSFDMEVIAASSIGLSIWRSWDDAKKDAYTSTFSRFLTANYAHQFDAYSGQSFRTISTEPGPKDTYLVKTELLRPGKDSVALDYLVRLHGTGAGIIDVFSDGTVSEAARRRSEFATIYRDHGFDYLIAKIESQIKAIAATNDV